MPLKLALLTQASFDGMRDSLDPQTGSTRKAKLLQNVYPVDAEFGGGVTGRPGVTSTQSSQLGTAGHRIFQRFYQFTSLTGTEYTVAFCGGLLYSFNWSSRVWTNIPLVGVGLSQDIRVFCVTYNNTLVVNPNDGTNLPWTWDGTNFVSLTNAPLAYGQPTVYYGKLFLIKWAARNTIDWSEENNANLGYEAGGFLNTWQLTQTDPNILYAIRGTNEALYYWRARSMGRILGAVTPTFSSDGTHDAISLKTGTQSPAAITDYGTDIFFLDADGRPQVLSGGGVIPLWQDARITLTNVPRTNLTDALAASYTPVPLVLMAVTELNQAIPNLILTIKPGSTEAPISGLWRGWTMMALDMVKNGSGVPTLLMGGSDGYAYEVGAPDGTIWDDGFVAGTVAVQHVVQGSYLGFDPRRNYQYDRIRILLRALSQMTAMTFDYQTPEFAETISGLSARSQGLASYWDQAKFDLDLWSAESSDSIVELGIQGVGRWFLPRLTHQKAGERFAFEAWETDAFVIGPEPVTV